MFISDLKKMIGRRVRVIKGCPQILSKEGEVKGEVKGVCDNENELIVAVDGERSSEFGEFHCIFKDLELLDEFGKEDIKTYVGLRGGGKTYSMLRELKKGQVKYVIEVRPRREDKTLMPWQFHSSFADREECYMVYGRVHQRICARVVTPNKYKTRKKWKWSKEAPKETGWYWHRWSESHYNCLVEIFVDEDETMSVRGGGVGAESNFIQNYDGEWGCQIQEPTDDNEDFD